MTPYEQGVAHYQAGDYQRALTRFTEAINQGYQPIDVAYYERSKCYEALGQFDAAKADLAHMLTLPIDEARRKEVTDLIALLDEATIKPLSKPDKIPLGFEVIENKAVFTINFVLSTETKIIITLDAQNLGVTQESRPLFNFAPIEVPRSSIGQIICWRESTPGPLEPAKESYVLRTDNDTLLIKRVDYAQIRYIQWLLRHQLHLLDTPQSGEYVPAKTGIAYDYKPIRKLGNYEALYGLFIAIFLAVVVIFGGVSIVDKYNEIRQLRLSPHYTLALVTDEYFLMVFMVGLIGLVLYGGVAIIVKHVRGMWWVQQIEDEGRITDGVVSYKNYYTVPSRNSPRHVYDVYYRYYGYESTIDSQELFDLVKVGDKLKIGYLPDKPHISKPYY